MIGSGGEHSPQRSVREDRQQGRPGCAKRSTGSYWRTRRPARFRRAAALCSNELVQAGVIANAATGARRADQDTTDASTWLRERGRVSWDWLVDETRSVSAWRSARTVAEFVREAVDRARLDPWNGVRPLILCESRTFGGVLSRSVGAEYLVEVAATNGQCGGFLHTDVAPLLAGHDRPVLYVGDWDKRGAMIEANTRRVLEREAGSLRWTRIALTEQQVSERDLPVIDKHDRTLGGSFPAVEVEALGQEVVIGLVREALDALLPEPIGEVRQRERVEREEVAAVLDHLL